MSLNRICIIGISATGKSTLARFLHEKLNLPLIHIDQIWWGPDWSEQSEAAVSQRLSLILKKEDWIIEGYVEPLSQERFHKADLIIYLDYSGYRSLIGGLSRIWKKQRPEMPQGCTDKVDIEYLKTMWFRRERPEIESALKKFKDPQKLVRLKSRSELRKFLKNKLHLT